MARLHHWQDGIRPLGLRYSHERDASWLAADSFSRIGDAPLHLCQAACRQMPIQERNILLKRGQKKGGAANRSPSLTPS